MTDRQWEIFLQFKNEFYSKVAFWQSEYPLLGELQKQAALDAKTPLYPFETSVVYNTDLDRITKDDKIKLIVIGDNPGKDEQLAKNRRYLVGQAGKIADGFFRRNPELGVDFRKNVIILNKTPVHSAKTIQLKKIMQLGGEQIKNLILESQLWMAEKTAAFYRDFVAAGMNCDGKVESGSNNPVLEACSTSEISSTFPELWLVGYSELKDKGFFVPYREKLKAELCTSMVWDSLYVFQHFSMNRFTIDLKEQIEEAPQCGESMYSKNSPLLLKLHFVGKKHKEEIFGLG